MKAWFTSKRGALALSLIALLTLLARSYYDTRFILTEEYSPMAPGMDALWILGFTAIAGGNVLALVAAAGNSRAGWITLLIYNLVTGLGFGAASLAAYTKEPLAVAIFSASLVAGVLAAAAAGYQIPQASPASQRKLRMDSNRAQQA